MSHSVQRNPWRILPWVGCLLLVFASPGASAADRKGQSGRSGGAKKPKIRLPESVRKPPSKQMKVTPVVAGRRGDAMDMANRIDSLVRGQLLAKDKIPHVAADDATFVRRVFLDVAGRIPTRGEVVDYLDSKDPNKRFDLIDRLLSSPDYVSHFYNVWADTLRLVERPSSNIVADPYLAYVKDSIRTNKPYDKWVFEMLTATGKTWENPAVGFVLRDDGMPLPFVDNTVRVFLGTQIGCAQCHDHPFDDWSQLQFYKLAAFTAGTRTRIKRGDPGFEKSNPANELIKQAREQYPKGRVPGQFQRLARANTYVVSETNARLRLPHDYAYRDAKPKSVVEPEVLWGEVPTSASKASRREQFAAWLTSPENPRFGKTIANRLWRQFMGVGLVEPIDDFNDSNPPSNEELMDYLSESVVEVNFDLKQFIRAILYSQTYAAKASDYDITSGEVYDFNGPVVRRMTAEQVWDSLLTLAVRNPVPFERPDAKAMAPVLDLDFTKETFQSLKSKSERFGETFFMGKYRRTINKHAYQGNVLCRASELPTPLPGDHFLRQFGQGDRETINGGDQTATVPQILAMFNGPITHVMLEPGSRIVDEILAIDSTRDRVEAIFLSVLSRPPRGPDRVIAAKELGSSKNDNVVFGNLIWALLNTREFLFIQ